MSWQKLRQKVLERDNYQCQICELNAKKLDIHHIIPIRKNGLNSLYNLVAVCRKCHSIIELDPPSETANIKYKIIAISDEAHTELNKIGERGESFSDIIKRLITFYEAKNKK